MAENNRLSHKDVERKLDKYKALNKHLSKKLTSKRTEIRKLKNLLTTSTSDIMNVQTECRKWKCNVLKIRNMLMDQTLSTTTEVQTLKSNADKMKNILDESIVEMDQFLAIRMPTSYEHVKKRQKKPKARRKF